MTLKIAESKGGILKAAFTLTVNDGKREVVVTGEVPLDATVWHDNFQNTLCALEQAIYNAFFNNTGATCVS